jgi:general secretion pathway protein L
LFIRLTDDGAATWAAFDDTGRLSSPVGRGELEGASALLEGRRSAVLVPAVDVISTETALPTTSPARLRQLVPFSLEESLADDVEGLTFAIGARRASGTAPVAVVARARMNEWIARLSAAGIVPQAIYSAAEGVPEIPATIVVLIEGERIYVRSGEQPPCTLEGLTLTQALELVGGKVPADGAAAESQTPDRVLVYVDAAGLELFRAELAALAQERGNIDVKVANDGVFLHLAATLAQRPGTNLLQGSFAPKSNWGALTRPWRLAASLLVASGVLALFLQGAQLWQLRRTDQALAQLVAAGCERAVGDARLSACQREVQQRLGADAASAGGPDFLATLAAIAAVRNAETRIDALSYRNRTMDLQLVAPNVPALDEFARGLEQTRVFDAEIEAANQSDNGTEGRVRIVGVKP